MLLNYAKHLPLYQTKHILAFWASGKDISMKMNKNGKQKLAALFGEMEWELKACS